MRKTDAERRNYFEQCIADYSKMINKVCYMYASDMENFNDLRQEVYINVWQGIEGFENRAKMSTWIYRVSLNTCITYTNKDLCIDSTHTSSGIFAN